MTSDQNKTRVALVGAGYVSTYHMRALKALPSVTVVGIADSDPVKAQELAQRFGVPQTFRTLQEMAAQRPDVVHILTPPASHCALTLQALELGCHVLVEKPMALSVDECDRMMRKAAETGRILSVNHSAKFDPMIQRALGMIAEGTIGDVLAVDYYRGSEYPPYAGGAMPAYYRDGGYPFRDIGVHGLYILEAFLGDIQHVDTKYLSTGRDPYLMFDEWHSLAECARGVGRLHITYNCRPMQNELWIRGTHGILHLDLFLQTCSLRRRLPLPKAAQLMYNAAANAAGVIWQLGLNTVRVATGRFLPSPDIHAAVMGFHESLSSGKGSRVGAEEGRRMVDWIERAAREADQEKLRRTAAPAFRLTAPALVTGGSGFLGTALVRRLLERGEKVRLLLRRPPKGEFAGHPSIEWMQGDLGDPEAVRRAVEGASVVYHVGATMNGWWEEFERGTIRGTANVVAACLEHRAPRLIYVSSMSVISYASLGANDRVDETAAFEPYPDQRGFYTKSKLAAEQIVAEAIRTKGLRAVILRPGQIFGPGAEKVPPYGVMQIGSRWIVIGNGSLPLPLVYVEDVVDGLLAAADKPGADGRTIQLIDPAVVTQKQYIDWLARSSAGAPPAVTLPAALFYLGAAGMQACGWVLRRKVPLTRYRLRSIKGIRNFDCAAARELLGWTPQVGTRQGLENMIRATTVPAGQPVTTV